MSENRITGSFAPVSDQQRRDTEERPMLAGVPVREDDIESVKGLRFIAYLFRGMAMLLLLLMILQVMSGLSGAVEASPGVVFAEAVRLVIFAGLLWGAGDLAVLWVKSHYDIRASRILLARLEFMMRQQGEANQARLPTDEGAAGDSEP